MLHTSLYALQTQALTSTSATAEEAQLRAKEAEMVLKFVEIAKNVEPRGQVVLGSKKIAEKTLLEDGDIIRIPEFSSVVMVHGEVLFPNAISFREKAAADDYIALSGGYTQKANKSKVLVLHQNGVIEEDADARIGAGDEIMVLPRVDTKKLEIARAISTIIYQIAIAARVVLAF
jgi:protein involved in polysaccharide export with SLBB domain